jgi:hypothetical protein
MPNKEHQEQLQESIDGFNIRPYLPDAHHGSILTITRSCRVKLGYCLSLGKMKRMEDSLDILSHAANRQNLDQGLSLSTWPTDAGWY